MPFKFRNVLSNYNKGIFLLLYEGQKTEKRECACASAICRHLLITRISVYCLYIFKFYEYRGSSHKTSSRRMNFSIRLFLKKDQSSNRTVGPLYSAVFNYKSHNLINNFLYFIGTTYFGTAAIATNLFRTFY